MDQKKTENINEIDCGCGIEDLLNKSHQDNKRSSQASSPKGDIHIDPDVEKLSYQFYMKNFTDGLPIIPPTPERVNKFYDFTDLEAEKIAAIIPPRQGKATIEKIAINAVMAGSLPVFMPLIQNSVRAIAHEKFNLPGVNATTHPVAICIITNGPLASEIGINSNVGCLGPGNIANATIGRALRLILMNIGGAIPGIGDHATLGSPSKYSFCFAEAENESPWKPLHVERGFSKQNSTTTVMAVDSPHNVNDHRSKTAEDLLDTIVHTAAVAGCNNSHVPGELLIIMGPEHAQLVASKGWNKKEVKEYIHDNLYVPAHLGDRGGRKLDEKWIIDDDVKLTQTPDDVVLVVAGGPGRHSMICHGFGTSSQSVTQPITFSNGKPVLSINDFENLKK
ncbi:MAG: hypothetical protein CIT01_06140 [Methanobacterium sp. BRmetb2]|jgi:hypothetical protein|nr:MAG: hypothetical protein CIT01_06140 [Methanobacterium sp. BRmetb2]